MFFFNTPKRREPHKHNSTSNNRNNKKQQSFFSLTSLNINGLNSTIRRHRVTDWIRKGDPTFCCIQETHLSEKDRCYLRVQYWKTVLQANGPKKQAGVAIPI
jgi:exonuclease III